MNKSISPLTNAFAVFASCMFMGFMVRDVTGIVSAIYYGIYGISALLILLYYRRALKFAFRDGFLWIVIVTALLSTFWSEEPELTLRRSIALLAATIFGIYLGICYNPSKFSHLLRWTLTLVVIFSLALAILVPSYAFWVDPNNGSLRLSGVMGQPNQLGRLMVLSTLIWLLYLFSCRRIYHRLIGTGMIALSLILLLLTKSASSLIACFLLTATFYLLQIVNKLGRKAVIALLFFFPTSCGLAYVIANNFPFLLNLLGRDQTLSGRAVLWQQVWTMIQRKIWFGYGFDAFWTGSDGPAAEVWSVLGWEAPYAHNGFLDLWLSLGLFGLIAFVLSIFSNILKAATNLDTQDPLEAILPALFLTFVIFTNQTEGQLVSSGYLWVLYVFTSTHLSVRAISRKRRIQDKSQLKAYSTP